jgi:hypothetical protein
MGTILTLNLSFLPRVSRKVGVSDRICPMEAVSIVSGPGIYIIGQNKGT